MNFIFLGPPGAGKGTQAESLAKKHELVHISMGDILRTAVQAGSPIGKKIEVTLGTGKLVDDDTIMEVLANRLSQPDCKNGFILDGPPRTLNQVFMLDKVLSDAGYKLTKVINIKIDDDKLVDRIVGRFSCQGCGAGYHDKYLKPKIENICDICGSSNFKRRADDNAEILEERLKAYHASMQGILDQYEEKHLLVQVDGFGEVNEVQQRIEAVWKDKPAAVVQA